MTDIKKPVLSKEDAEKAEATKQKETGRIKGLIDAKKKELNLAVNASNTDDVARIKEEIGKLEEEILNL